MKQKTTLEVIAPTVDEAIANGLAQLGLPADAVDVEILDSGSRGFLGLGSRQARVRLSLKDLSPLPQPATIAAVRVPEAVDVVPQPVVEEEDNELDDSAPLDAQTGERALGIAQDVVRELLEKMKVKAEVTARYEPPVDEKDQAVVMVEVQGNDLSILIGRRSEVLNALQYIASLIVSKEIGHWVPLMLDVQGYRTRRERQLRMLARRMAEQAIHTGKRQMLEPMTASERRIIHLELRNHPDVDTESTGDEPNRKVVIRLKKG